MNGRFRIENIPHPAGGDVSTGHHGQDVAQEQKGSHANHREYHYYHYYEYPGWHMVRRHFGIRTDRYKLIRYYEIDEWELFDLETDPGEMQSVYDDPAYASVVQSLTDRLFELRETYQVPEEDTVPYVDFP